MLAASFARAVPYLLVVSVRVLTCVGKTYHNSTSRVILYAIACASIYIEDTQRVLETRGLQKRGIHSESPIVVRLGRISMSP